MKINSQKTLLMLSFFLLVIVALQISRMDIFYNNERFTAPLVTPLQPMGTGEIFFNPHQSGKIALLYDPLATDREYVLVNFQSLLEKNRFDYDLISVEEERSLKEYVLIIVLIAQYDRASLIHEVFDCVEAGATAYFPIVPENSDSLISISGIFGYVEKTSKLSCHALVDKEGFIGQAGQVFEFERAIPLRYWVRLRSDCTVYIEDEESTPLLWSRPMGKGLLYVNHCDFLSSYQSRGVIMEILYRSLKQDKGESLVYPISGTSTLLLEEFVSPFTIESSPMLEKEKLTYEKMMQSRIWPFISKLIREFNIKPVLSYVISYSDKTDDDYASNQFPLNEFKLHASEILDVGGEIAFHGYSMRPLGLEGQLLDVGWFVPWPSIEKIREAWEVAKSPVARFFPSYDISTYMPPQGRIAPEILAILPEWDQNIEVIPLTCRREVADQWIRDMERDDENPEFFYYTLVSCHDGLAWTARNTLLSHGMVSMTLNMNQVLQTSGKSFAQWSSELLQAMKTLQEYPALQQTTIREAAVRIEQTQKATYRYKDMEDFIDVEIGEGFEGMQLAIRSSIPLLPGEGYSIATYSHDMYLVTLQQAKIKILK